MVTELMARTARVQPSQAGPRAPVLPGALPGDTRHLCKLSRSKATDLPARPGLPSAPSSDNPAFIPPQADPSGSHIQPSPSSTPPAPNLGPSLLAPGLLSQHPTSGHLHPNWPETSHQDNNSSSTFYFHGIPPFLKTSTDPSNTHTIQGAAKHHG